MTSLYLLLSIACLFAAILLIFANFFNPSSVKRRQLARIARQHFQNSRGTAHLRLMCEAEARLETERQSSENKVSKLNRDLAGLDKEQDQELSRQMERYLVETKLTEIPGIGTAVRDRILSDVFQGRLTDLHRASILPGVGEARQQAIDRWVQHYSMTLPLLIKGDFAGKPEIVARFAERRSTLEQQLTEACQRRDELQDQLDTLRQAMEKLDDITEDDFRAALTGEAAPSADLDAFNHGVFAEWESMPDWFRCIVLEEEA